MTAKQSLERQLQKTLSHARLSLTKLPACREIQLYLYDPEVLQGPISHEQAQAVVAEPAYWSFCWASGQILARFILDNPEWVRGKSVLDLGAGSGVVGIAAAMAGADTVTVCDIDSDALAAAAVNATANKVTLATLAELSQLAFRPDIILAADILYDRDNYPLLNTLKNQTNALLLADSRVKTLPAEGFDLKTTMEARTCPDLNEFEEFNQVRIYSWQMPQ